MAMASGTRVALPWENIVCADCLDKNPYAIWLVKYCCFDAQAHKQALTTVVIDVKNVKLVRVRQIPTGIKTQDLKLCKQQMCQGTCRNRGGCTKAHSKIELDTWNAIYFLRQKHEHLMKQLRVLKPTISSEVCKQCLSANARAVWLTWLTCIDSSHSEDRVTVVMRKEAMELVPVPVESGHKTHVCKEGGKCKRTDCSSAHSQEELEYWKWSKLSGEIYRELEKVSMNICKNYSYPCENSASVMDVVHGGLLSCDNYKEKFHKLVYLDNLEHARKMVAECDGDLTIDNNAKHGELQTRQVHVVGMSSTRMDYAFQKPALCKADITVYGAASASYISGDVESITDDTLVVRITAGQLPLRLPVKANVHFEYAHWKFQRLHCAIEYAQPQLIERLTAPSPWHFPNDHDLHIPEFESIQIDSEYQPIVLRKILEGGLGSPFLLLGPFGTGKTHLLLVAALTKGMAGGRILICTHHNRGADIISKKLASEPGFFDKVLRLYPNNNSKKPNFCCSASAPNLMVSEFSHYAILVTTFTTALKLSERQDLKGMPFSHIIIDEGAQSREPEALGALLMAGPQTHLIIAGDNKQVGPDVLVLSDVARKNGLGESLIERLLNLYEQRIPKSLNQSRYSLLTNYRCHPSILMLASTLFYDCTLQSRTTIQTHPLAAYPIVFQCSSLQQKEADVSRSVNKQEAELLVSKALEFITTWPESDLGWKPSVALMAGSDAQVNCLRSEFAKLEHPQNLPCSIQFSLTYSIQGSEFDAVFLSTHEPTDKKSKPLNTVRSICNEYVFNTVITRSRSLIFVVGNPFHLIKMSSHFSINCWSELIKRCLTCQSFHLPQGIHITTERPSDVIEELHAFVFSPENTATTCTNDSSNEGYRKLFLSQKDERIAKKLVKNPEKIIGTRYWYDSDDSETDEQQVATGELELLSHRKGKILSDDPAISGLTISLAEERRCHFSGQKVRVDKISKKIIVDVETAREINKKYFGYTILCRVQENSMIRFYPFNKTIPVLNNMPNLTRDLSHGVVCFDPNSIDDRPKACNFIPRKCAVNMVFLVTYLRWRKHFPYPLGIVTGALPSGKSVFTGDPLLKLAHNIPRSDNRLHCEIVRSNCPLSLKCREFNNVITIDPKGSKDHDDALSCVGKGFRKFEIGVHITDVQVFVPKDSEDDRVARARGCSVYSSTAECVSHMLPQQIVEAASILPDSQPRDSFSVVAKVVLSPKNYEVRGIDDVNIVKSRITSKHELTYAEAQTSLFNVDESDPLHKKLAVLWAVACYLRQKRLKGAAKHISVDELDEISNPEAHVLVEELMIWANKMVAIKLFDHFPVIHRCQSPPNQKHLDKLVATHGQHMAVSLDLQQHVLHQETYRSVAILQETLREMKAALREGNVKTALHQVLFEHLQPQVSVAHALFNVIRNRASYCVAVNGDPPERYSHNSLNCEHYTHFTSPIRRYIDLVVQRMLLAALNEEEDSHSLEELQEISRDVGEKLREADKYEKDRQSLDIALQLQQSSRDYICFVKNTEEGELTWTFHDVRMKAASRFIRGVQLKYLNAISISQRDSSPEPEDEATLVQALDEGQNCSWKVKTASAEGSPHSFLANRFLVGQRTSANNQLEISMFTGENEPLTNDTNLKQRSLYASICPFTQNINACDWKQLQKYACSSDAIDPESVGRLLPSSPAMPRYKFPHIDHSPLWVYKLRRPIQSCEVLRVQLTGCFNSSTQMISPAVQLLEVGPNLRVCIQHNSSPADCFTDTSQTKPPKRGHVSIEEYFHYWERALLAEAATASILDTELLIITDVKLEWPELKQIIDSQGHVFYKLPTGALKDDPRTYCVCMKLSKSFATSSHDFFNINEGDLMCVRCFENDGGMRGVFHMVVHSVEDPCLAVYLKFVGEKANFISPLMLKSLNRMSNEVQLIPLNLPNRRMYKSLCKLRSSPRGFLSHKIATGTIRTGTIGTDTIGTDTIATGTIGTGTIGTGTIATGTIGTGTIATATIGTGNIQSEPREVQELDNEKMLTGYEARVASSIWSSEKSEAKLNCHQLKAVQLACHSQLDFVMIQGPPGTGKSMTGAHIAYALAVKLRREPRNSAEKKDNDLNPCVMYCGPSQQSVNVVLDILTSSKEVNASGLKIVRVYSNAIESKDFLGPKYNPLVFSPIKVDGECKEKFTSYALHHLIRQENPKIKELDQTCEQLKKDSLIPSSSKRKKYRELVTKTSTKVLKNNVDIVLCTCNEAGSYRISHSVSPEYCIIDECAMATEPECMVAIRRAKKVILIGDHKQLQPVLRSTDAMNMGMSTSLFERFVNSQKVRLHMLQTQYRMHEALCEFPSNEFYDSKLETDKSVAVKHAQKLDNLAAFWPQGRDTPMMLCDVVGVEEENHTGHRGSARVGLESKRNTAEAKIIAAKAEELISKYGMQPGEIAAITPYSAQKEEIKNQLQLLKIGGVVVKTIMDAQGSEFGIVLLSTVRSQPLAKLPIVTTYTKSGERNVDLGWRRENLGFITDRHQICVGITRCKYGLIIVGNKRLLTYDSTWRRLVEHYEEKQCTLVVTEEHLTI